MDTCVLGVHYGNHTLMRGAKGRGGMEENVGMNKSSLGEMGTRGEWNVK